VSRASTLPALPGLAAVSRKRHGAPLPSGSSTGPQIVLADTIGEFDKPAKGLTLGRGKAGTPGQPRDYLPEFRPAAIEIEKVAGRDPPPFLAGRRLGIPFTTTHGCQPNAEWDPPKREKSVRTLGYGRASVLS